MAIPHRNRASGGLRPGVWMLACAAAAYTLVTGCLESPGPARTEATRSDREVSVSRSAASLPAQSASYVSRLLGGPHDFSRGRGDARSLCLTCHTPEGMTDGAARPPAERRPREAAVLAQDAERELDRHSLVCLGCHDGVIAADVFTSAHAARLEPSGPGEEFSAALAGHPIGGRYPSDHPRYRAANAVTRDGRIRLPEGRVQCVSCHDPHHADGHPAMLVKSNERSALCLSCHRL